MIRRLPLALALALATPSAFAAGFDMSRGGEQQIQVYADNGIEWYSEAFRVIARGNAKVIRGTSTLTADTVTAYYRKGAGGSDEIWRLDADGNVVITTPTEKATGYKATYELDKAIFLMRGTPEAPATLVTPKEHFTATDTLEYWENEKMAVARGNAVAVQKDNRIQADTLTAHFLDKDKVAGAEKPKPKDKGKGGGGGSLEMERADAYGHVILTTPQEVVTGERGDYNAETGIATVTGSVKITRDNNQLNGGYAHVNLNTGISKLFGSAPGQDGSRAQGVFVPEKKAPGQSSGKGSSAVFSGPKSPFAGTDEER